MFEAKPLFWYALEKARGLLELEDAEPNKRACCVLDVVLRGGATEYFSYHDTEEAASQAFWTFSKEQISSVLKSLKVAYSGATNMTEFCTGILSIDHAIFYGLEHIYDLRANRPFRVYTQTVEYLYNLVEKWKDNPHHIYSCYK